MPIDDLPPDALKRHFELEDSSRSPVAKTVLDLASRFLLKWPFDKGVDWLKERFAADSRDRLNLLAESMMGVLRGHDKDIKDFKQRNIALDLLEDAIRKAFNTRAHERVKRIGLILANGMIEPQPRDGDEIEEMMRVAMELSDDDVRHLAELVQIEGEIVARDGRISRYSAHEKWGQGFWGTRVHADLDSVFSKLESYGLVSRLAPPNNLNITADFQNRYALVKKGLRFVQLIREKASTPE